MAIVCLDPGHGVETPGKRSPDGTYYEHEFALNMAYRVKAHLERHGVKVVMTRLDEHNPTGAATTADLARRVAIANDVAGLDLFVSLHSNAAGNGVDWAGARGLVVYAYGDALSVRAAEDIMAEAKRAGITVRNGGKAADGKKLYVIRNTVAPAVLIEHLFHDNRDDLKILKSEPGRRLLAEVDAKGILDYLGIDWVEEPVAEVPWYAEAQAWAVKLGLTDGARPLDACTRAEAWTMLMRLYQ